MLLFDWIVIILIENDEGEREKRLQKQLLSLLLLSSKKTYRSKMMQLTLSLLVVLAVVSVSQGFVSPSSNQRRNGGDVAMNGIFDKVGEFFEELDAFVDDATSRRLGAGASFYGKRKSKFYGENDSGRKADKNVADPLGKNLFFCERKISKSTPFTNAHCLTSNK